MTKYLSTITYSSLISIMSLVIFYFANYSNDRFIIKGLTFSIVLIVYTIVLFYLNNENIVYLLIFMTFLNVPIAQLYTSTTNIFIIIAVVVIFVRNAINERNENLSALIKNNGVTLPLILLVCSYTLSLLFVRKELGQHLMMYHSIIFASILVWMIISTIRDKKQINIVNNIMLTALILNLLFSVLMLIYPQIDSIRANVLSLFIFSDEEASRIQGLSFRGEGYGEYTMICACWLFSMLLQWRFQRGKFLLWVITFCTIATMIMTRSRGAAFVFIAGAIIILITSRSVTLTKKAAMLICVAFIFVATLIVLKTYSKDITILDRFQELTDTSKNVGYIPESRYYTWVPSLQLARSHHYMGVGPSFAPYIDEFNWREIVAGREMDWPHNIILLVLSTVGIYGLLSYLFLVFRTMRLRKVFENLEPYLRSCYSAYLVCFIMFLFEAQKFDGFLRHPDSNFYFIFILIALLFSCENMVDHSQNNDEEQHSPST